MPQKKPTPSQKCKETATGKKQARNPECNGKGQIEKQPWTKLSVKLIFIHKIYQLNIRVKTIQDRRKMGQNGTASNQTLFSLPGHVASALVVFLLFVRPLLRRYQGLGTTLRLRTVQVRTGQQIPSAIGREEYVRVRLEEPPDGGLPLALPVYGKSGLLGPLIRGPRPPARGPQQRGVGLRDRSHGAALPHPLLRIRRMPTVI